MQRGSTSRIIIGMDPVAVLLDQITETLPQDRRSLRKLKTSLAARLKTSLIRNDALLARYRLDVDMGLRPRSRPVEQILTLNGIRSQSGIAIVTVVTEPYPCPGRCVYCPTEMRAPKSYLTNEPAVMRAVRNNYDPYRQVCTRLSTLHATGHPTDKIELIIKGGTWSFYPQAYQRGFIQACFEAANDFANGSGFGVPRPAGHESRGGQGKNGHQPTAQSPQPRAHSLEEVQRINETAKDRIIGITIETRPDYVDESEISRLREMGITRVELGVQTLEEEILKRIVRDHATAEVRKATLLLKEAGFKVAYHIMPNLPGASPASDLQSLRSLFEDSGYQPDALKLYPCVVIESAELSQWWRDGRYIPYDDETLIELLIAMKQHVPPYVRIERVIRDIPSTSIRAGCTVTNLREEVFRRMRARGLQCRCIRCRQVRSTSLRNFALRRYTYEASGGTEVFLSLEDAQTDRLGSLLRLRIPSAVRLSTPHWMAALNGAALIRELHTYGQHVPLNQRDGNAAQHQGFGRLLLGEAERIAREEFSIDRMAVISGIGAREYYRRLGYSLEGTYMVKDLRYQIPFRK